MRIRNRQFCDIQTYNGKVLKINPEGNNVEVGNLHSIIHLHGSVYTRPHINESGSNRAKNYMRLDGDRTGDWSWAVWKKSDAQLKQNIYPLKTTLEKVLNMKGKSFDWDEAHLNKLGNRAANNVSAGPDATTEEEKALKEEVKQETINKLNTTQVGFIAQDVEKIFPEWVREGKDGMKEINMSQFNAVLVEAIKELKAEKDEEIQELKEMNETLRANITALEGRLKTLEEYQA